MMTNGSFEQLRICQVFSGIAVVNVWWTPKAFKGKGCALPQQVTSEGLV